MITKLKDAKGNPVTLWAFFAEKRWYFVECSNDKLAWLHVSRQGLDETLTSLLARYTL